MFCEYCGNQLEDDALFCSKCGKHVTKQTEFSNEEVKIDGATHDERNLLSIAEKKSCSVNNRKKKEIKSCYIIICLSISLLFLIIGIGYFNDEVWMRLSVYGHGDIISTLIGLSVGFLTFALAFFLYKKKYEKSKTLRIVMRLFNILELIAIGIIICFLVVEGVEYIKYKDLPEPIIDVLHGCEQLDSSYLDEWGFHRYSIDELNETDKYGNTALMYAARYNCPKTAKALIKKGASVFKENYNGETAIDIAIKYNSNEVLLILRNR